MLISENSPWSHEIELEPNIIDQYCLDIIDKVNSFSKENIQKMKYKIGEILLECNFFDTTSYKLFHTSMLHLKSSEGKVPDWRIYVINKKYSGPKLPKEAIINSPYQGIVEYQSSKRFQLYYIEHLRTLFTLNYESKIAVYWTSSPIKEISLDFTFPIRYIAEAIYRNRNGFILHSGVVGKNGKGVLFTGKSGSGKSTTSLACLLAGFDFICDDHCLYHNKITYNLTQFAKLTSTSLEILSQLEHRNLLTGNTSDNKIIIPLLPNFNSNIKNSLTIKAVIQPILTQDPKASLIPCSAKESLKSLAPSSFSRIVSAHKQELSIMSQLVKSVPNYKLFLNEDLRQAINLIAQIKELQ